MQWFTVVPLLLGGAVGSSAKDFRFIWSHNVTVVTENMKPSSAVQCFIFNSVIYNIPHSPSLLKWQQQLFFLLSRCSAPGRLELFKGNYIRDSVPCSSRLPYITSFNTLNCHKSVTQAPSWYLHLSDWNHKYNHFPNVGSLFCQLFQNATVPLHFRGMNKWKAINMSLSLHCGTLHCMSIQRTMCLPGLGLWCPICKATKIHPCVQVRKKRKEA